MTDSGDQTKVFQSLWHKKRIKRSADVDFRDMDSKYYVPAGTYERLGLYDTMAFTLFRYWEVE